MIALRKIITSQKAYLLLFVLSWFIEVQFTLEKSSYLAIARIVNILLIAFYYSINVKNKRNNFFFGFLFTVLVMNVVFALKPHSPLGIFLLGISRIFLLLLFRENRHKLDKNHFIPISLIFIISLGSILYLYYQSSWFFTFAIFSTILLTLLLSVSFTAIVSYGGVKGSIQIFLASFLFLISDSFLGSQKTISINQMSIVGISTLYYIGYFLIIEFLKKQENTKKNDL